MADERELWDDPTTCDYYGFSRTTLWRRIRDSSLPAPVVVGGVKRHVAAEHRALTERAVAERDAAAS